MQRAAQMSGVAQVALTITQFVVRATCVLFWFFFKVKNLQKKNDFAVRKSAFSISVPSSPVHTGAELPLCKWHCRFPPAAPLHWGDWWKKEKQQPQPQSLGC